MADPTKLRVRFTESPLLPPMKPGEMMRLAPIMPGDPVTFVAKPGELTPERIGRQINALRDEGYAVEVVTGPPAEQ